MEKQTRKYTICAPDNLTKKLDQSYDALSTIDCNFSRLLHCILNSITRTCVFILKRKKNFRHYNWYLVIEDKETGDCFTTCKVKGNKK